MIGVGLSVQHALDYPSMTLFNCNCTTSSPVYSAYYYLELVVTVVVVVVVACKYLRPHMVDSS